jgi:hypothetical protein
VTPALRAAMHYNEYLKTVTILNLVSRATSELLNTLAHLFAPRKMIGSDVEVKKYR